MQRCNSNISLCCCFRDRIVQLGVSSTQAPTKRILKKELTFETRIGNRFHFGFKHALVQASPTFYLQKNGTIAYDILRMVAPMYNNTRVVEKSIKLMKWRGGCFAYGKNSVRFLRLCAADIIFQFWVLTLKILEICKIIGLLTAKDWHWLVCPDDELVTVAVSRIGRSDFKLQKIQTQLANGKIAFVINLKASAVWN